MFKALCLRNSHSISLKDFDQEGRYIHAILKIKMSIKFLILIDKYEVLYFHHTKAFYTKNACFLTYPVLIERLF